MRKTLAALCMAMFVGVGSPALAGPPQGETASVEGVNDVSALKVNQKSDGVYLRLRSSQTPSFSVFKLKNPLRLVVDVSNSHLADQQGGLTRVDNGVVSRASLLESRENGASRVRLIVGFDKPAHYDVRTEGNDVVIFVEGGSTSDRTSPARAKLEKKEKQLTQTQSKFKEARTELKGVRGELSSARDEISELKSKIEQADGRDRKKLERRLERKSGELSQLESELASKTESVEQLRERVGQIEQQRDAAKQRLAKLEEELSKERSRSKRRAQKLEELRAEQQQVNARLEDREAKYRSAVDNLEETKSRLEQTRGQLERLRQQRDEAAGAKKDRLQGKLDEMQSRVDRLAAERNDAKTKVAELKKKWKRRLDKSEARYERAASNLEQTRQRLSSARDEIEQLRQKRAEADGEDREQLESTLERKTSELRRMEQRMAKREATADKLRGQLETLREEKASTRDKLDSYKTRLSQREQTIDQLKERVSRLESREAGDQKVAQLEEKIAELKSQEQSAEPTRGAARAVPLDSKQSGESGERNEIRDIRLETDDGESRIVVELERPGQYRRLPKEESRAVMLLNNVDLPDKLEQTIAAGDSGAVRFVSSYTDSEGQVRMEAELSAEADEKIRQKGNKLVWEFAPDAAGAPGRTAQQAGQPQRPDQGTTQTAAPPNYPRTVTDPSKVGHVPGMGRKKLTIDLRDADIHNVLRLFAKEGGVNIIAGDNVGGKITLRLRSVPLDQAFLIILQSLGLGFETRGNVIRVAPQKTLLEEQAARQKAQREAQKTRPLEVFLMPVNYASASDMTEQVNRLLSPRGSVSVDSRTNTLIIKDLPENIKSIRQLVGALDAQVPQVLIEARIVETNDTFSQEFGIQWGGDFSLAQGNGNPTGLVFPNVLGVGGGATDGQTPTTGTSSNPNFAVNLPAAAGTGSGGAIGLTMGSVGGSVNLNLRLSAAEQSGRAKIVSAPKILTLDNREATISQGTSIPISVVSAAGVQTVFVDATLELTVTPHVTPDGNVQLEIEATKNEPDFQNTGARGDPTIIRKQAETELLIEDGETTVIGGIYTRNSGSSISGVPILHQIPILGLLFKKSTRSERRTELLIFITPRVVNRAEALGGMSAGNIVESGGPGGGDSGGGGGNSGGGN